MTSHSEMQKKLNCGEEFQQDREGKIYSGHEVKPGQFAWMVAISIDNAKYLLNCTGQIIASKFVLSAAHCLLGARVVFVFFGYLNHRQFFSSQNYGTTAEVYVHSKYKKIQLPHTRISVNDIALIKLKKPVDFTDVTVGLACLPIPENGQRRYDIVPDSRGTILGYGVTQDRSSDRLLRYANNVIIIKWERCNKILKSMFLPYGTRYVDTLVHDGIYCMIGDPPKFPTVCRGDSGGGLYQKGLQDRYALLGVITFGYSLGNDCDQKVPSVFSDVSYYLDWIYYWLKNE